MPHKGATGIAAAPSSPFDFLFPAACRTLARCSPLRTSEAHDAGQLCFIDEIGDVLAILPLRHALIMMASVVVLAHAKRIANEESTNLVLLAESDDLPR